MTAGAEAAQCAGNAISLVWESKELLEISAAFLKLIARSAGQQAAQLALYATVSGVPSASIKMYEFFAGPHMYLRAYKCLCWQVKA